VFTFTQPLRSLPLNRSRNPVSSNAVNGVWQIARRAAAKQTTIRTREGMQIQCIESRVFRGRRTLERGVPLAAVDEAYLRAHTIGELETLDGRVTIADYDPAWPVLFEREAARIQEALGPCALRIEHIGSTSVPGLAAKPVIDILLAVADSADESAYLPALERAGYTLRIREPEWHEHRMCKGPDTDVNLHVFSRGCPEIDRVLAFRDWLRAHPADRERYERTKRELASREWKFTQQYADAKSVIVQEILARALSNRDRT
jgi:GrpB-like predicted nucleotidyltransferase (UPF0157 family)